MNVGIAAGAVRKSSLPVVGPARSRYAAATDKARLFAILRKPRRCARDAKRKFRWATSETEITASCCCSQEQGRVMIALPNEERLPRSWPSWWLATEAGGGSARGILLKQTFLPACPVTR